MASERSVYGTNNPSNNWRVAEKPSQVFSKYLSRKK
jgi:hypothetical protein